MQETKLTKLRLTWLSKIFFFILSKSDKKLKTGVFQYPHELGNMLHLELIMLIITHTITNKPKIYIYMLSY